MEACLGDDANATSSIYEAMSRRDCRGLQAPVKIYNNFVLASGMGEHRGALPQIELLEDYPAGWLVPCIASTHRGNLLMGGICG